MKLSRGIVTGIMLGAVAGVISMPMMNHRTRRRLVKTSRRMRSTAEKTMGNIVDKLL